MVENQHTASKFINAVDKGMHDSILRLNQKLKGLQAEIEGKIEAIAFEKVDEGVELRKKHLLLLADEVNQALEGIKTLVNMTLSEEVTDQEFAAMNEESLLSLRQIFDDNIEKISKLQSNF